MEEHPDIRMERPDIKEGAPFADDVPAPAGFTLSSVDLDNQENESPNEPQKMFLSTSPPTNAESAKLSQGLFLAGQPLQHPLFHPVDPSVWRNGQRFTAEDDPDRTLENWTAPDFVADLHTAAEQNLNTTVEYLPFPDNCQYSGNTSFARVIHNVLTEQQCAELIESVNNKGFTPALLNIGRGEQMLEPYVRNGHRVIVDSAPLSTWLFEVIKPHLPEDLPNGGELIELNERLRFLCYTPGQEFAMHCDGEFRRPPGHLRKGDCSKVTVQIYLHDVPEENGGATTFDFGARSENLPCQPKAGSALIFSQDLPHEGSLLSKGLKYTVRTEAMYSRQ